MEDPEGGREGVKASLLILHITQNIYLYIMFFAFLLIILEEVGFFFLYQELIYRMLLSLILHHSDDCSEWWFMLNGVDVTVVSFTLVSAKSE